MTGIHNYRRSTLSARTLIVDMSLNDKETGHQHPYEHYKWRKSSSGLWERDLDECERFYATFCRGTSNTHNASFPVTGCASFQLQDDRDDTSGAHIEHAFKHAWAALGVECPALCSWIDYDKDCDTWRKVCKPFINNDACDSWAASTFHIRDCSDIGEWFNSHPPTYRSPHLFLIHHGSKDETHRGWLGSVALRSPHDTVDGIGVLQLLNRLLELAGVSLGKEVHGRLQQVHPEDLNQYLPLPMRVATDIDPIPGLESRERWEAIQAQNIASATAKPRLGLPITGKGENAGSSFQRASTVLPRASTSALMAKCKEHGITVTHALSAAMTIALRDLHQPLPLIYNGEDPSTMRYTNNILVNLRQCLSSTALTHNVGNYHMIAAQSMAIDVPVAAPPATAAQRFVSVALQFRDYYQSVRPPTSGIERRAVLDFAPMTWEAYTPKPSASMTTDHNVSTVPTLADVAVSSLGNISVLVKAEHGPLRVSGVWVAGVGLGAGVSIFLGGWDGEIEISCVFDKAFHARADIVEFLDKIVSSLADGIVGS